MTRSVGGIISGRCVAAYNQTGCPWCRPRVSLSIYLLIKLYSQIILSSTTYSLGLCLDVRGYCSRRFSLILFGGKQATLTLCHLAGLQTTNACFSLYLYTRCESVVSACCPPHARPRRFGRRARSSERCARAPSAHVCSSLLSECLGCSLAAPSHLRFTRDLVADQSASRGRVSAPAPPAAGLPARACAASPGVRSSGAPCSRDRGGDAAEGRLGCMPPAASVALASGTWLGLGLAVRVMVRVRVRGLGLGLGLGLAPARARRCPARKATAAPAALRSGGSERGRAAAARGGRVGRAV